MSTGMAEMNETMARDGLDHYLAHFDRIERQLGRGPAAWFLPVRKAAISRFAELGFPTTQDEEWRYTSVAPIAERTFDLAASDAQIDRKQLPQYFFPRHASFGGEGHLHQDSPHADTYVFVNGRMRPELSIARELPSGVRVMSLAAAMAEGDAVVREHLARHARFEEHAFTALNTALLEDGVFVHVAAGTVVPDPIHLLFVSTGGPAAAVSYPRTLIVAEANSQVSVVETYAGVDDGSYLTNAVSEVVALENATVDHHKIVRESDECFHIGAVQLNQVRDGNIHSFIGTLNGGLVRHEVTTLLDGEGGHCAMNGLYMVDGSRHVDNHLVVEHAKAHCDSREFFKGILDGQGKGIFSGRIIVRPGAQKTDAKQTNMSLLLSQDAQVESKPQLEIFADDVKCTHGATIGQINDEGLFYLRSRGIHEDAARSLLVYAFAAEVLDRVRLEPLRDTLAALVAQRLPGGELLH